MVFSGKSTVPSSFSKELLFACSDRDIKTLSLRLSVLFSKIHAEQNDFPGDNLTDLSVAEDTYKKTTCLRFY